MKKLKFRSLILAGGLALTSCSSTGGISSVNDSQTAPAESASAGSPSEQSAQAERGEDIVITIAVNSASSEVKGLQKVIDDFNASDNGYRIEKRLYQFTEDDEFGSHVALPTEQTALINMEVVQDIINTDEIDIISNWSFCDSPYYEILKNKGAYIDLYQFMEDDPEVNRAAMNSNILSLAETDGKLYTLPTYVYITTLVGSEKYVGDKENWTVDDFISAWEQMPDNATINSKREAENTYYTVLRGNLPTFLDYENAQVHFDSPEFRRILEFCGTFPSDHGQKTEDWDFDAPKFVGECLLSGIMSSMVFDEHSGYLDNPTIPYEQKEKCTLVGYPSSNGCGAFMSPAGVSFSISANSSPEKQRAAWEFIRTFGMEEWQVENCIERYEYNIEGKTVVDYSSEWGICVNNNAFDKMAQRVLGGEFYNDTFSIEGVEYESPPLPTEEDVEALRQYIDTVQLWEVDIDRSLWEILNEEILGYLSGEKSIDYVVDHIQNRAELWISEKS